MKNTNNARSFLRALPKCGCFPSINGFEVKEKEVHFVIGELEPHSDRISDEEFIKLFKSLYECARHGIYFGRVTKDRIKVQKGKTVIIPNFDTLPRVISGQIENPFSFFTTVKTLATIFRNSGGWPSKIYREKMDAIFHLMKELSLEVQNSQLFLPSLGVWRHEKFIEALKNAQGHIYVPMIGAERFLPFLSKIGRIFSSIEEIKEEVYRQKEWRNIFSNEKELSKSDLMALAFFFPMEEKIPYFFNTADSVEMHVFCNQLRQLYPSVKIVEFLHPFFEFPAERTLFAPKISKEEIPWFLRTFFGKDAILMTDVKTLFASTKGELFALSSSILNGRYEFVENTWKVYPLPYEAPKPYFLIKSARHLARIGEKPSLGLEYVKTAENISGRKLELFESLKAFFYKVLGKYEKMNFHFEKAEEFGKRTFRNAYYAVVLSMNGKNFSLMKNNTSPLIEIMRKYAVLVSKFKNVVDFYDEIIFPLEKIRSLQARRVECMARNYAGLMLELEGKIEEAIDEFETALSIAQEYKFNDLKPLIEMNISIILSEKMISKSNEEALRSLKDSMNEGLKNILSFSYLMLALNAIETGEIEKGEIFLKNALKADPAVSSYANEFKVRINVENLEDKGIENVEDVEERENLKFMYALYTDNEKMVREMMKNTESTRIEKLSSFLKNTDQIKKSESENYDYLMAYFLAKQLDKGSVFALKKLGKNIYMNNLNLQKIFYEEQLSKVYRSNGLEKSADYHMNLAALIAKKVGLKRRYLYLSHKVESRSFVRESYEFFSSYTIFRNFGNAYETLKSLATFVAKILETEILCQNIGVENYTLHTTPEGNVWNTSEKPDMDFAWIFGMEYFVYLYWMQNNTLSISFKTKNIDMDKAILALDHVVPFYATHVEKSLTDKVSNIDSLTNLYSRRYIMNKLAEEVERSRRYNEFLSVAMLDIDNFKRINDRNGHDVGDEVLRRVAQIIMDNVRSIDTVGRYGGEEFLIVFPHTPLEHAVKSCERIRRRVESAKIIPSNLTVSLGVAQLNVEKNDSVDEVVKNADIALYWAKSYGKNKVIPYIEKKVGEV